MRTELVTTLKRHATDLIGEIAEQRQPIMITQHGIPAAYLVDAQSYEEKEHRVSLLEGIAKGEKAIQEERVFSHEEAREKMGRWLK